MVIINADTEKSSLLNLGRQGEHGVREVWFDLGYLIETFGAGSASVAYQRSQDGAPYPVVTTTDGEYLIWRLSETDMAYEGFGQCEVRWTVGENLAKTVTYRTMVAKSMTGDASIPDPYESWYDELMDQIGDNEQYATDAQQAAADAEAAKQAVLGAGITITATVTNGDLTFSAQMEVDNG